MTHPTIYHHYSEDHDRLDALFRQFQARKSADRAGATNLFREFKAGLERHILWEEEILFPGFEQKTGVVSGPTEVMRWEHRQIRGFMDAIAEKLARDDFDTGAEEVGMLSVLGPHNEKEEGILYPMIDQITGAEERAEIYAEMSKRA